MSVVPLSLTEVDPPLCARVKPATSLSVMLTTEVGFSAWHGTAGGLLASR